MEKVSVRYFSEDAGFCASGETLDDLDNVDLDDALEAIRELGYRTELRGYVCWGRVFIDERNNMVHLAEPTKE